MKVYGSLKIKELRTNDRLVFCCDAVSGDAHRKRIYRSPVFSAGICQRFLSGGFTLAHTCGLFSGLTRKLLMQPLLFG
ncbi:hypothetical protein M527_15670 [Sphingobium indicum IP26]|nr:hypothetical protein M527_15670 [Sphingobium indicum IP26]